MWVISWGLLSELAISIALDSDTVAKKSKNKRKQVRRDVLQEHHVARYCNSQVVDRDPENNAIRGVFPQAFELKTNRGEEYLSLCQFEYFAGTLDAQFKSVLMVFRDKIANVRSASAIVRLNCGAILAAGTSRGHSLRMRDRSSDKNRGYAGLEGMPKDNSDLDLLGILANKLCLEVRGVQEIDNA